MKREPVPGETRPCKQCGRGIFFAVTEQGGKMPLDATALTYRVTADAENGLLRAVRTHDCFASHFATCPVHNKPKGR